LLQYIALKCYHLHILHDSVMMSTFAVHYCDVCIQIAFPESRWCS